MFLSQRPNNDKRPWDLDGVRFAVKPITPGARFDPRPEFTQTRDPLPWIDARGIRWADSRVTNVAFSPRHEEFDTPVNPILEAVRLGKATPAALLKAIRTGNASSPAGRVFEKAASRQLGEFRIVPSEGDWYLKGGRGGSRRRTDMEVYAFARIDHARRVLSKLVAVYS